MTSVIYDTEKQKRKSDEQVICQKYTYWGIHLRRKYKQLSRLHKYFHLHVFEAAFNEAVVKRVKFRCTNSKKLRKFLFVN